MMFNPHRRLRPPNDRRNRAGATAWIIPTTSTAPAPVQLLVRRPNPAKKGSRVLYTELESLREPHSSDSRIFVHAPPLKVVHPEVIHRVAVSLCCGQFVELDGAFQVAARSWKIGEDDTK